MNLPLLGRRAAKNRLFRFPSLALAALLLVGCSAQPMTLDQELTSAAIAGVIGAGSGAVFAASANQNIPASIFIGAAGMAGFVLLYEEIKREAALSNTPPVPSPPDSTSPPAQNP